MKLLLSVSLLLLACGLGAQTEWEVPQNVAYEKHSDYIAQNENIVAAADYLRTSPVDEIPYKRKMTNKFVVEWLTSTPTMTITLQQDVVPFMADCGECLTVFMAAYAKHAIIEEDAEESELNYLAIKDVLEFYQKNIEALGKQKALDRFKKMERKDKLREHIEKAS